MFHTHYFTPDKFIVIRDSVKLISSYPKQKIGDYIAEVGKTCKKCGTFFLGNKCPNCGKEVLPVTPKPITKQKRKPKGVYH